MPEIESQLIYFDIKCKGEFHDTAYAEERAKLADPSPSGTAMGN